MAKPSAKAFMGQQHSKAHIFHEAASKEHGAIAEYHAGAAEDHTALAKAFSGDPAEEHHKSLAARHGKLSKGHASLMKLHADHAEDHAQAMEMCDKADAGGDLTKSFDSDPELQAYVQKTVREAIGNTVMPSSVSGVVPTAPGFGIRSVPRIGQQQTASEAPKVALEFAKVFSVSDGEELRQ